MCDEGDSAKPSNGILQTDMEHLEVIYHEKQETMHSPSSEMSEAGNGVGEGEGEGADKYRKDEENIEEKLEVANSEQPTACLEPPESDKEKKLETKIEIEPKDLVTTHKKLEVACRERSPSPPRDVPKFSNKNETNTKTGKNIGFSGRFVSKVMHVYPITVSKRFVKPQMIGDYKMRTNPDGILRKLFGVYELKNVLLLITPISNAVNDKFNLHGYIIEDRRHLGVTNLSKTERNLLEHEQKSSKYSLIFSSGCIELQDAFMNTPMKELIFKVLKNKSSTSTSTKYRGNRLFLQYGTHEIQQVEDDTPNMKIANQPRIRCHANGPQQVKPGSVAKLNIKQVLSNTMFHSICSFSEVFHHQEKLNERKQKNKEPLINRNSSPINRNSSLINRYSSPINRKCDRNSSPINRNCDRNSSPDSRNTSPINEKASPVNRNTSPINRKQEPARNRNTSKPPAKRNILQPKRNENDSEEQTNRIGTETPRNRYSSRPPANRFGVETPKNRNTSQPPKKRNDLEDKTNQIDAEPPEDQNNSQEVRKRSQSAAPKNRYTVQPPNKRNFSQPPKNNKLKEENAAKAKNQNGVKREWNRNYDWQKKAINNDNFRNLNNKNEKTPIVKPQRPIVWTPKYNGRKTFKTAREIEREKQQEMEREREERKRREMEEEAAKEADDNVRRDSSDILISNSCEEPALYFDDSHVIVRRNSAQFDQIMNNLVAALEYTEEECLKYQKILCEPSETQAFYNIAHLLNRINSHLMPNNTHLIILFRIFDILHCKLIVREECYLPGCAPTKMPRYRIDSFLTDKREDYFVSLSIPHIQLSHYLKLVPGIEPNIKYIDDAFDLIKVPTRIVKFIRKFFRKPVSRVIAEICFNIVQPISPLVALTADIENNNEVPKKTLTTQN